MLSLVTVALVAAAAIADGVGRPDVALVLSLAALVLVGLVPLGFSRRSRAPTRGEIAAAIAVMATSASAAVAAPSPTATMHALTAVLGGVPPAIALVQPRAHSARRRREEHEAHAADRAA